MSSTTEQSHTTHAPDYIVIGQMLDNPEKVPFSDQDVTLQTQGGAAYYQPPEYVSPISPTTPSEPISRMESSSMGSEPTRTIVKASLDRVVIATRNETLSSGFPYDPKVYDLISQDEWHDLSSDIVAASKLTFGEDWGAWATGITTGTLSSAFIVFFGPVAGYYAGRSIHRKTVVKVAKERLERDGDIRSVLRRWNEQIFQGRGFQVWLELPIDGGEIKEPKVKEKPTDSQQAKMLKAEKKTQGKIARRFKIVIIPNPGKSPALLGQDTLCESPLQYAEAPLVEAMGNELNEPVELDPIRKPAELQEVSSRTESKNSMGSLGVSFTKGDKITTTASRAGHIRRTSSTTIGEALLPVELEATQGPQSTASKPQLSG